MARSGSARTAQRSPAKARTCWFQPIGDSQVAQPGDAAARSPMARRTYAAPTTISPRPIAARPPTVTWAVTAPTPAKQRPVGRPAGPEGEGPSQRQPGEHERGCGARTQREAGRGRREQGRRERGHAPDHSRADELEPTRLLLGAGVPDDEDDHEDRDHRGTEGGEP